MKSNYKQYILHFKRPSGTSRGIMHTKETWFVELVDGEKKGIGECGVLRGLSIDDRPDYEEKLQWVCKNIESGKETLMQKLTEFPSIQFGLETAFISLQAKNPFELFPSKFTEGTDGIVTNGLIWMGDKGYMNQQVAEKIEQGYRCIKLKIGAIDFNTELDILKTIRKEFSAKEIELRVDANGAFSTTEALEKLKRLFDYDLHSIEQPIKAGQWQEMARLCEETPLPIALDEELIGIFSVTKKKELLQTIQPQYIILKPSLIGGFSKSDTWIELAENQNCGWWMTSALESNIGLNAIAQYTYTKNSKLPQGLGTGSLYTNNIKSPLEIRGEKLYYNIDTPWKI